MAKNDTTKVFVGKPKAAGAMYWAAKGTTPPTDASTPLGNDVFACLGYCSEDGLVETEERETEEVKAWGGDIVLRPQTSYSKQYAFTPIQSDADVLRFRFGAGNVEVAQDGGITVTHNSGPLPHGVLVAELALGDSMILRKVIPDAQIIEFEDTSYVDGEPIGYGATVAAFDYTGEGDYAKDYYAVVEQVSTGEEPAGTDVEQG